jgi:hypothetical protein
MDGRGDGGNRKLDNIASSVGAIMVWKVVDYLGTVSLSVVKQITLAMVEFE